MGKICIFSRTSTVQQDVEQQTTSLIQEAERIGYTRDRQVIVEYQESATKLDVATRQGINKLKDTIINDTDIDTVICWELTRIARRADVIYNIRDFLLEHKTRWIILKPSFMELIDKNGNLTPTMSLMLGIFTSFAESEMMIKNERFKRARETMKDNGQKFSGRTMFGYMKNKDKKMELHPFHAPIIVDIFNHYINNDSSLYETYTYVSGKYPETFPMLAYKRAQHKVRNFLINEVYAKGNWCYPPIVTEEMWMKAKEKMSKAKCGPRHSCNREMLCRGKMYCGHCGKMMTGCGGHVNAYCCSTDKLHSLQINMSAADWLMWEETRAVVNIDSQFNQSEKIEELKSNIKSKATLMHQYETKVAETKDKMDKLVNLYLNSKIDTSIYNDRYDELKEEEAKYTKEIDNLRTESDSLRDILEDTQRDILNPHAISVDSIEDFDTRQELVRKYIKKMIVTKDDTDESIKHITFEYNRPIVGVKSSYMYVARNQHKKIYRVCEDGNTEFIYEENKVTKKNKSTGKFEKES